MFNNKLASGIKLLNFQEFVSWKGDLCVLRVDMGCWDTKTDSYHVKDKLHLGKRGVRLLAHIVRECVLGNKQGKGSSGSYRNVITGSDRPGAGYWPGPGSPFLAGAGAGGGVFSRGRGRGRGSNPIFTPNIIPKLLLKL